MSTVVSLDSKRWAAAPDEQAEPHLQCFRCGGVWFELRQPADLDGHRSSGAVVLNREGSVVGYSGLPYCIECGQQNVP